MRRTLLGAAVAALVALTLSGCEVGSTVSRPAEPVVLTGSRLPDLLGAAPGDVVAFRHSRVDGEGRWTQVPVQVDERKVVDFGSQPSSNTSAGVTGTVYGTSPIGVTALQYADAGTFVGADGDRTFDANDELVFMTGDAGGSPAPEDTPEPAGVVPGSGVAVRVADPLDPEGDAVGWVHLFESAGGLDPSAGRDYVDYDFALTSGSYRSTYKRADGPNPETSRAVTSAYEIGFGDRWIEHTWRVRSAGATGVDVLDGHKNQFAVDFCGRSNLTFADAEGAFVANIDGPVRAIRSYVGANSGPLTQRTHLLYRDRQVVVTDLRVHSIPGVMDFLDLSTAARGMTYRSSVVPGGVPVDGVPDGVGPAVPGWEAYSGPQGLVLTRATFATNASGVAAGVEWFHRDQTDPPEGQCWGDGSFLGAAGPWVRAGIPNTDPRSTPVAVLTGTRTTQFGAPLDDGAVAAAAGAWSAQLDRPLSVSVSPYRP